MINYVPFLKLKSNEIMALKDLDASLMEKIIPFFDFAKRRDVTETEFENTAYRLERSLKKNVSELSEFYLDNYDIEANLFIAGKHNYYFLLSVFQAHPVIPVVSVDRSTEHNQAVVSAKDEGIITSNTVAFRVTEEDFINFDLIYEDIQDQVQEVFDRFEYIDLIIDGRVCINSNSGQLADFICAFIQKFFSEFNVRKIIITGSSIPASIADITGVNSEESIARIELEIFDKVFSKIGTEYYLTLGDYGAVSPNYSDVVIPGGAMRNITAPKIIYPHGREISVIRGAALATHPLGNGQYEGLLANLVAKPFFRGKAYSAGESYIEEKSRGIGTGVGPTTMVKPLCNLHITYMCRDYVETLCILT